MNHKLDITTRRTLVTVLIFCLVFPLGEMWQFWKGDMDEVNPWLFKDYPLAKQWFFKDLSTTLSHFIPGVVVYRVTRLNKPVRFMAGVYLAYRGVDLALFFLCYNSWSYTLVYAFLIPVAALLWLIDQSFDVKQWMRDLVKKSEPLVKPKSRMQEAK